jgi:hypothetical protein
MSFRSVSARLHMSLNAGGYLRCVSEQETGEQTVVTSRISAERDASPPPPWPCWRDLRSTVALPSGIPAPGSADLLVQDPRGAARAVKRYTAHIRT